MLEIEVCEIRGKCPVYKVGDKIVVDGAGIVLDETDAICILSWRSKKLWNLERC